MNQDTSAQSELDTLNAEYGEYIAELRREWLARNRSTSRNVYEVMSPWEREEVQQIIARWGHYIAPLAEAWWRERGYGVIWPEDNAEPMQLFLLEAKTL